MVQILKNKKGFSIVEIMVGTLILGIAVLAFFSAIRTSGSLGKQAKTNDVAQSIARQRLALMQDGELLVRPSYTDSVTRDGITYTTFDVVDSVDSTLPQRLTITVSWDNPTEKSITLSGYLNRDICPDTGIVTPPDSISISNNLVPEGAPAGTFIGNLTVHDPDSSDLHMFLYEDSVKDNELFRIEKGKLYSADVLDLGVKTMEIGVSDCAGNEETFEIKIKVTTVDSVPVITPDTFDIDENSAEGAAVDYVIATPAGVTFNILDQQPVAPFTIGTNGGLLQVGSAGLNHEVADSVIITVQATNVSWHDTEQVLVRINDVNEPPTTPLYSGKTEVDVGTTVGTLLGTISSSDPDVGDNLSFSLGLNCSAFPYFAVNPFNTSQLLVKSLNLEPGIGDVVAELIVTDGEFYDTTNVTIAINDTTTSPISCGSYQLWEEGSYSKNFITYYGIYIYQAKWYTTETPSFTASDWKLIDACPGAGECEDFVAWDASTEYGGGTGINYVAHNNVIYFAKAWSLGTEPPNPSKWTEVVGCN